MTAAPPFRAGDHVRHAPTEETWVVAYADPATGYMSWCGWPNGEARISDCTLVRAASDAEHQRTLRDLKTFGGWRWAKALRLYGEPEAAPALEIAPPLRGRETFESIAAWAEETFGPIKPARIVGRADEEMAELRADPESVEEAADVVICLARYPGLWAVIERKMAVNRQRQWRRVGDGTGYHIKPAAAPVEG